MPEYLAPGVYIEETSYRAKSIEGVSTSTAGFVGPTRTGPTSGKPEVLTSFADFQRTYGGLEDLAFDDQPTTNYLAHAARAFFEEGGARLYVMRIPGANGVPSRFTVDQNPFQITAREAGVGGDVQVTFGLTVGSNVLTPPDAGGHRTLTRVRNDDSVVALDLPGEYELCTVTRGLDGTWALTDAAGAPVALGDVEAVYPVTVTVDVARPTVDSRGVATFGLPVTYGPLSLSPAAPDGVWSTFPEDGGSTAPPVALGLTAGAATVATLTDTLFPSSDPDWWLAHPSLLQAPTAPEPAVRHLTGGKDGAAPTLEEYLGDADAVAVTGLAAFEAIEDISIVAAPGSTELAEIEARAVRGALLSHCERMRYRVAVLDVPRAKKTVNEARDWRNEITSTRAAIYYPWVKTADPFGPGELLLPPSGHVAGIWARNDINRAVFKAPANEPILSITDLERRLTKGQQDVLNPDGVNCLRFFAGRGNLVWGARTVSDDPEWKYVSVRRYMAYLERSIERGTQWAVFEPNGDALWANVRRTIEDFLVTEWKTGALLGREPKEAFFVRCDRTTMTQNDLDNGRLVCLIGVAVVKPAEFVIFRIGQWTAASPS
ncbi:MAG TPA: phage tail sheath subtilisin-like domain-containing protein [Acidimicrobiales bacterium]|nr:phage tail sheath subtilisin-like domain-containing protein [Acidimicrobiales bacterium]